MSKKFITSILIFAFLAFSSGALYAQADEKPLPDDFDKSWNKAEELYKNKEFTKAIKIYKELVEKLNSGETRGICYYNIACCELKLKHEKEGLINLFLAIKDGFRDFETYKNDEDLNSIREHSMFRYLLVLVQYQQNDEIDHLTLKDIKEKYFPEPKPKPTPRAGTLNFTYNAKENIIDAKFYANRKYSEQEQTKIMPMLKNYAMGLVNQAKKNTQFRKQLFQSEDNFKNWENAGMPVKLYVISTNNTFKTMEIEFLLGKKKEPKKEDDKYGKLKKEFNDMIDEEAEKLKKEFKNKAEKLTNPNKPIKRPKYQAYLGIRAEELTAETREFFGLPAGIGVLINSVNPGSPAEAAGLQPFDVILFVNETKIASYEMLRKFIVNCKPADVVTFVVLRDDTQMILPAILGKKAVQKPEAYTPDKPENPVKPAKPEKLNAAEHGYIGIYLEETESRLRIMSVVEGSPAHKAGLQEGDRIDMVGDDEIYTLDDLKAAFAKYNVGDMIKIVVARSAMRETFELRIAKRP